jgi:hypothetical protein
MGQRADKHENVPSAAQAAAQWPRSRIRWLCLLLSLLLLIGGWLVVDWWTCLPDNVQATFVGRSSCVECHAAEVEQ